jgi:hypothetical protein
MDALAVVIERLGRGAHLRLVEGNNLDAVIRLACLSP